MEIFMSEKIVWTIANAENLISFLKKFTTIDTNALLEFSADGNIKSNCFTAAKSATKSGSIPIEDVFDIDDTNEIKTSIRMGIYNISKFIANIGVALASNPRVLTFTLEYDKDKDGEYYGKKFIISGDTVEMEYPCANKTLFRCLKSDVLNKVLSTDDTEFSFDLDYETISTVNQHAAAEVGTDLTFVPEKDKDGNIQIIFKGRNFKRWWNNLNAEVDDSIKNWSQLSTSIKKDFLKFLDKETYRVYSLDSSIVLVSTESNFKIVLAKLIDDVQE